MLSLVMLIQIKLVTVFTPLYGTKKVTSYGSYRDHNMCHLPIGKKTF